MMNYSSMEVWVMSFYFLAISMLIACTVSAGFSALWNLVKKIVEEWAKEDDDKEQKGY